MMMRMLPVLAALDANGDGKISTEEINNATAALKKLDKNKDGELTTEEMRPNFASMGRGGPPGGFGRGASGDRPERGRPDGDRAGRGRPDGDRPDRGGPDGDRGGRGRPDGDRASRGEGGPRGGVDPAMAKRMFEQRDKNNDGKLSGDEIPPQMAGRLQQIDTDKDGSVSKKEIEAMMSRFKGQRRPGGARSRPGAAPGGQKPRRPEAE